MNVGAWSQLGFAFGHICSSTLRNVFALLLLLLFFFFFNVKLKFLELHICMCGISGVRVISNLLYPYAFIFLPVPSCIFFNWVMILKLLAFLPSFEGHGRSSYIEKAFLLSALCIGYRHNSKGNRKDRGRSKSPSPKKEVYQRRHAPGYTR